MIVFGLPLATLIDAFAISWAHVYYTYPFVLSWSLVEAMACGLPVIATETPGMRDYVEHGVTGFAFNLEEDNVGAALVGEWEHVKEGEPVRRTGQVASVPVGDALLGRSARP